MANHKSAAKKARADEKRNERNRSWRTRMRSEIKIFRTLLEAGKQAEAAALLPRTLGLIDRTAKAGIIKVNTASRYKSRLTRAVNRLASA
jgi:small subunit ribosomal protein S20